MASRRERLQAFLGAMDEPATVRGASHPLASFLMRYSPSPAAAGYVGDPSQTPARNTAEVAAIQRRRTPGTEEYYNELLRRYGGDADMAQTHMAHELYFGEAPRTDEARAKEGVRTALDMLGGGFGSQLLGMTHGLAGGRALGAQPIVQRARGEADDLGGVAPEFERKMGQGGEQRGTLPPATRARTRFRGGRERSAYPGIYADPRELALHAEARVAPESGSLSRLFDTTRQELSDVALSRESAPAGWQPFDPDVWIPGGTKRGRPNVAGERIWTPSNVQRLTDATEAAREHAPGLWQGMTGWYVSDPMYQRMVELMGPEEATREFLRRENLIGMASPGAPVPLEVNRGSTAAWLARQGRFPEFVEFGGNPAQRLQPPRPGQNYPGPYDPWAFDPELRGLQGHPYHSTSQALPMQQYLESGQFGEAAKVPSYVHAWHPSEFPSWQGHYPVGDAHWSRAVGLGDVRTSRGYAQSATTPEMTYLAPRYDLMARELGLSGVPQQALHWGLFSPQTGVKTEVGVPKLELIADMMEKQAARDRVPATQVRDMYLTGDLPLTAY